MGIHVFSKELYLNDTRDPSMGYRYIIFMTPVFVVHMPLRNVVDETMAPNSSVWTTAHD